MLLRSPDIVVEDGLRADVFDLRSPTTVPAYTAAGSEPFAYDTTQYRTATQVATPTPTVPSTSKGVLDYLKDIGTNILGTAKTTLEATIRGGLEGGITASSGAQTGARVGASTAGFNFTFLLLGAFAIVAVLYLRKR